MKKRTIIAIIIALLLILAGVVLLVMGLSFADNGTQETATLQQQEVLLEEGFTSIQINTGDCDVNFVPYEGVANAHVVMLEGERVSHSICVEDGTLKIQMQDNRKWTDHIGIFSVLGSTETMNITVYLPNAEYDSVYVTTDTGDIRTPAPLSAGEIILRSDTGDIYCDSTAAKVLDCMTSTGDIQVRSCTVPAVKVQSETGDISLYDVQGTEIYLQNDTGETVVKNVICQLVICNSSTGDVELQFVTAEDYVQVFTDTGDVEIGNAKTASGNIETNTGDIGVPASWKNGNCRIETDTGNIYFQ